MTITVPQSLTDDAEPPRDRPIVQVEDLAVSFDGGQTSAVAGVSFQIAPGECVALVGESGSGKSVTARALLGVVGKGATVTAERLFWHDTDLARLSEKEWREIRGRHIGLVLQDALGSLDPLRRVGAEVGEALVVHDLVPRREVRGHVLELLARVGTPDPAVRARQYPHEMSGGLRQRALIASSIAADPDLIVADEPTTALDVTLQARILDLLADLKAQGKGLLLISHDLAVVARLADRVLVLRAGEVVESGATSVVLQRPTSEYTRQLIASVPGVQSRGRSLVTREPLPPVAVDASSAPVITVDDVSKTYPAGRGRQIRAVSEVSFSVRAGEVLGIVGESGSGKSTVGRILLGHVAPDAGRVTVHGQSWREVRGRARRDLRRRIQIISQDPLSTFDPRYTVERIVAEALPASLRRGADRRARVLSELERVGLDERHLARSAGTLSGGQRQRVAIARALAADPDVLVCDEAVSALDVTVQAQVLDLLAQLRRDTGVAMVFISHDLGVVHHIADRVLVMKDGVVVESGEVHDVLLHPQHDYTRALIAAIPSLPTSPEGL